MSAHKEARAMIEQAKARPQSVANDALIKKLEEIAPPEASAPAGGGDGGLGFGPPPPPPPATLANVAGQLVGSVMGMQGSEMAPTEAQLTACKKVEAAYTALIAKWTPMRAKPSR